MKKIALVIAILAIAFFAPVAIPVDGNSVASAADVTVEIVIPDAQKELLIKAVKARLMYPGATGVCEGLNPAVPANVRTCYIRWVLDKTTQKVKQYHRELDNAAALATVADREFEPTGN